MRQRNPKLKKKKNDVEECKTKKRKMRQRNPKLNKEK